MLALVTVLRSVGGGGGPLGLGLGELAGRRVGVELAQVQGRVGVRPRAPLAAAVGLVGLHVHLGGLEVGLGEGGVEVAVGFGHLGLCVLGI